MKNNFKNIMLVKLRTLGDILTTFPLIRALQERFPKANLHVLVDEQYQELFAAHPRIHRLWPHPAKALRGQGAWTSFRHQLAVSRSLRAAGIDLYIDLYGSMRTALWGYLAGIPTRMGFNLRGRKYFYTHRIVAAHRYVTDINLQFAEILGWRSANNSLEFFLTPEDIQSARLHLERQGWRAEEPYIVISPGGGWPLKCWDPGRFGETGRRLTEATGCRIVLSGAPMEQPLIEACARELPEKPFLAVGLPLRQAAAVIRGARLFLGNDSGPKYFAEAFQVPTLICYGPTDYLNNNPVSELRRVAVRDVPCRPCHSEVCKMPRRICLDDLTVDEVADLALHVLRT